MTYRFGPYRIDDENRILLRQDSVVPLTPKGADLLLLLVSRPGHVFEKQHILDTLWRDSFVEEGSIAQNVSQLRKILGDSVEKPIYIETIPKRGYRWVAPLEDGNAKDPAPRQPRFAWRGFAIAATASLVCATAAILLIRGATPPENIRMRPFTSYRGGEYAPAFSRDGQKLAFVWRPENRDHFDIYIRSVEGGDPVAVTSDEAEEGSVSWSPDGNSLVFVRYGENTPNAVVVRSLVTGTERTITPISPMRQIHDRHVDWSPVDDRLVLADRDAADQPYSLYLVALATGRRMRLTQPPPGSRGDTGAVFSRDGRTIAFRRTLGASVTDIYTVPASGGEPKRLTSDGVHTSTHDWTADGRAIVFSSNREGGFALWRVSAGGGTPERISTPPHGANFLSIAPGRLALSLWYADTNIWRYAMDNKPEPPRQPLIASTQSDISPQISPDGTAIAFRSNRTGFEEIWVAESDGARERQLSNIAGPLTGSPRWSPDSRWIAFDSRPGGKANIFVVHRSGGKPVPITSGDGNNAVPSWSADGRFIYFSSNRTGSWQIWRAPVETSREPLIQITFQGGFAPFPSRDGRFIYYAKGENTGGIWRVPAEGGPEEAFCAELLGGLWGQWAAGRYGLYLVDADQTSARLARIDYRSRAKTTIRDLPVRPFWNDGGLAISPDETWFLYAQADSSGSDIYIVDAFR